MGMVNTKLRGILGAFLLASVSCVLLSNNSYAAVPYQKSYTDANRVTWYVTGLLDASGPVNMTISYNGATNASSITTLHIPSYNELTSNLDFAGREVEDTYILGGVPDPQLVGAELTSLEKIDFTDAAKIQIRDITSIMDGVSNEVELVFGDDTVIADPVGTTAASSTGTGAFEGYDLKLTNLDKVKYIGWNAFKGATLNSASREITINSNQTIGGHTFEGTNVTKMTLNTAEIGEAICKGCNSLTSVSFGDDAKVLHGEAFLNTPALAQTINTNKLTVLNHAAFKNSGITGLVVGSSLAVINDEVFRNTNLGSIDFGDSRISVGFRAFNNAGLNSVKLGNVASITTLAFAENNLTEIVLPKSIASIEGTAIFANNPLKKLTIAFDTYRSGTSADTRFDALFGCNYYYADGLVCTSDPAHTVEEVVILAPYGESDTTPDDRYSEYFYGSTGEREGSIVANSKNILKSNAFLGFDGLKKITIGEGYEVIRSQAFALWINHHKNDALVELNLPDSLKSIGEHAFATRAQGGYVANTDLANKGAVTLESLPSNLEFIGTQAFFGSYGLTINNFDLPKLKYIGNAAFTLVSIKNITLHDSIEDMTGSYIFAGGKQKIESLTFDMDYLGKAGGFYHTFGTLNLSYYTSWNAGGYFDGYSSELEWSTCGDDGFGCSKKHFGKITFTEKATTAPDGNKMYALYADELDLSRAPWTTLEGHSLIGGRFTTLKLPQDLKNIGMQALYRAEVTNPVTIPEGVVTIGDQAFMAGHRDGAKSNGVRIESVPDTIESIGYAAFYNDENFIADVDLPDLNYLGYSAFQGSGITGVTLSDNIQTLGYNAFYNANDLKDVTIDLDLYGVTREYGDTEWSLGSCWQQDGQQCPSSASDAQKRALRDANFYDSFVSTFSKTANYGTITFTEKAGKPCGGDLDSCTKDRPYFYGIKADKIDLSATNWSYIAPSMFQAAKVGEIVLPNGLVTIGEDAFFRAEMNSTILPASLKTIGVEAFQWAKARINQLPEGLKTIDDSAFYEADVTDDLVIPAGITKIGKDAFNANSEDIHYNSITLKGDLTYTITSDQPIFVVFYNAVVDKMIIESADLPALHANDGIPEFHAMRMKEVVLTKLPEISANAFEECDRLEKVDARADSALRAIDDEAFINDVKLKSFLFSTGLKNETVTIGKRAFQGTAFETMGDSSKDFDLTAANFEAMDGYAFSGMPKLRTVDIPRNFSHATIPVATFYNDTALEEATLDYKITLMDDAAFAQDVKLKRIFIWGNTVVKDETLDGYTEPAYYGHGGPSGGSTRGAGLGVTIPENTDIYAYSTSPTESYAAYDGRDDFDGTFYPLDEVIYLTSNNPTVLINEDSTDFDKSDLIIYGLRRDGVVLESDSWQQFDGKVYARSAKPLTFEKMAATIAADPAFGTVYDTPVPINELSLENENFANINFELVPSEDDPSIRVVNIIYTDAYTDGKPDTDIDPYREPEPAPTPAPKPDKKTNPDTSSDNMGKYFAILVGCTGAAAAAIAVSRLRKKISL